MDKQVTHIIIAQGSASPGWSHTLAVSDYEVDISPEFWGGGFADESISGVLRQNFKGMRPRVSLNYSRSTEANEFRTLFNDMVSSMAGGDQYIWFYPDASASDRFQVVPAENMVLRNVYRNTIGRFVPSIELVARNLIRPGSGELTSIPGYLEGP